ncbi:class I SAM-dependent methyltransferase [Micromonospora sp. CPCC 206061]|uniref:class I SAM-dependent methyltransferase n=1 Tax=Micromonospora sp. CPCC 206061 TaxID=3122410 RepID=UPI002FEFE0DE
MTDDPYTVVWSEHAAHLHVVAREEAGWYAEVAQALIRPRDMLAVDIGCGGAGMTRAMAAVLGATGRAVGVDGDRAILDAARSAVPDAQFLHADLDGDLADLRAELGSPADLVWASASVHHAGDQQAAVDALATLLGPGGRLALAEGGLPPRHLPWDVGVGEPGLEIRLDAAQDRWFARMRAALPGSRPMPYGWTEALRRSGLTHVTTRTTLVERVVPLSKEDVERLLDRLTHRVDRLRPADLLAPEDLAAWDRLLDPADEAWLGNRTDLSWLDARSVHIGTHP